MRTEEQVIKDFEKLGYDNIHIYYDTKGIVFRNTFSNFVIIINKQTKYYRTNDFNINIPTHKLIHELFEIWGWL